MSVVIVLVILLLVGVVIIVWRYRRSFNGMFDLIFMTFLYISCHIHVGELTYQFLFYITTESTCCPKRTKDKLSQENIEMSDNSQLSTSGGYYNSIQLHDELRSGERPAKTCQDTYEDVLSDEPTYYTDVNPDQERIYQEIKNENHYQPLDFNRQAVYEKSQGSSKIFM